ncbi:hypothetical protein F5Y10DRAFT_255336 [Nemania abortiva]|nr:hypothetical protein F5Y10DRAFT_255336 [Nemania abortiva]
MDTVVSSLSLVGSLIQVIDLWRRFKFECTCQINSARRFDQGDASSFKIDMDEITAHLLSLRSMAEGTDMEGIVVQCFKYSEDISKALESFQEANSLTRTSLSLYICDKMSPLRQQLPALALKAIRGWYDFEAQGLLTPILEACPGSYHEAYGLVHYYHEAHSLLNHINRFPPAGDARWARGPAILHLLTSNIPASSRERWETRLKNEVLDEIYKETDELRSPLRSVDSAWERNVQQSFLQHLRFPGISDRKAQICDAYGTSFNWILDPSVDTRGYGASFRHWLSNHESSNSRSLFWLHGKPGAGKSTLMKFVSTSLEKYREDSTTIASFFFHATGTPIQKNSNGLLRSFLLQIIAQNSGIVSKIAPSRWEALVLFGEDPKPLDMAELQQMLISALGQRPARSKTFLFIDGLDEYENHGSYFEILELILKLTAYPGVKICISSRPLPQLQDVIDSAPSITLENCTRADIKEVVTSKIEAQLSITLEPSISLSFKETVAHELTRKASGCFLWVVLVVNSLQRDLADGKGVSDLLHFVNDVPTELDELFRIFLGKLDASRPFMASTMRFIVLSQEPLSPLRFSFMEMDFPEFVMRQKISSLPRETLRLQTQKSIEKIVSESKGLLEVSLPESYDILEGEGTGTCHTRIDLIHRSLREFLEAESALSASSSNHKEDYDLAARYCAASLSILKISTISDINARTVSIEAFRCAYAALFTVPDSEGDVMRVLDELEFTYDTLLEASAITHKSPLMGQGSMSGLAAWYPSDPSVARDNKISARLRQRATALCLKYDFARLREEPSMVDQLPDSPTYLNPSFPMSEEGDYQQVCFRCLQGPTTQNMLLTGNASSLQATDTIERVCLTNLNTNMENPPAQFRDDPLEMIHSRNAFREFDPDTNGSDNMSWESFSSTESSLDEAHPLMAFKAEVVQAVLQGFMKYRRNYDDGDSKGHQRRGSPKGDEP